MKFLPSIAANSAVTVSNIHGKNDPFHTNFHLEFTTEAPIPKRNDDESLAAEKNSINQELGFSIGEFRSVEWQ